MARIRDPNRDKAFEIWKKHNGKIDLVKIAEQLDIAPGTVRGWKSKDKWDAQLNGTFQKKERNAPNNTERSKKNTSNNGSRKGIGNPSPVKKFTKRNSAAVTHGFFQKYLPAESLEIMQQIEMRSPLDMLWDQIIIQYTAIIRAQQIMFVIDKDDMTKEVKKTEKTDTEGFSSEREEWEIQFAWDKQATFLQAQSRAMSTLQSLIRQYEDLCRQGYADEEQQLRIAKLKGEIELINQKVNSDEEKPIEIVITRKGDTQ